MSTPSSPSVVFAGGGCRTFWGLGLYAGLRSTLPPVREWSGTSAGAAMAIAAASGLIEEAVESFVAMTADNPRNVYPEHLLRGRSVFPHDRIYRATVRTVLEKGGWESLQQSAPVRVLLAYVKRGHSPVSTCVKALWSLDHGRPSGEEGSGAPLGLETRVVTVQQARGISEVVEWVLSASSTPPLTKVGSYEGQPYVDGGLVDNVPVRALSEPARKGKALVIHSRPRPRERSPGAPNRLHLAPATEPPVKMWDYASPAKIRAAFALGRADAKRYENEVRRFVEHA